eukprot:CAMPEP_0185186958 /NCGR_PEP_ID=MMETSP1140-20130426/4410_1 /TAXON_ID=298111 /ORGANISM="Pavlova sp., Strain CCMP459" /LENGTH=59 /DNA_ID=CAMNT_0027753293 /DNA_START=498 /DNA_END=674 /DNA_ORIENTATION=-
MPPSTSLILALSCATVSPAEVDTSTTCPSSFHSGLLASSGSWTWTMIGPGLSSRNSAAG